MKNRILRNHAIGYGMILSVDIQGLISVVWRLFGSLVIAHVIRQLKPTGYAPLSTPLSYAQKIRKAPQELGFS